MADTLTGLPEDLAEWLDPTARSTSCRREMIEIIDDQQACKCLPNGDGTYDSTNCYVSEKWFQEIDLNT